MFPSFVRDQCVHKENKPEGRGVLVLKNYRPNPLQLLLHKKLIHCCPIAPLPTPPAPLLPWLCRWREMGGGPGHGDAGYCCLPAVQRPLSMSFIRPVAPLTFLSFTNLTATFLTFLTDTSLRASLFFSNPQPHCGHRCPSMACSLLTAANLTASPWRLPSPPAASSCGQLAQMAKMRAISDIMSLCGWFGAAIVEAQVIGSLCWLDE